MVVPSLASAISAAGARRGLKAEPDVGDNGVHASASPFEALAPAPTLFCRASPLRKHPYLLPPREVVTHGKLPEGPVRPELSVGPCPPVVFR